MIKRGLSFLLALSLSMFSAEAQWTPTQNIGLKKPYVEVPSGRFYNSNLDLLDSVISKYSGAVRIVCTLLGTSAGWNGADVSAWIINAEADLPSVGGIVDAASCFGIQTISQQIDAGVVDGTKAVLLRLPHTGTWTVTMSDGTSYGLMVHNKSAALGSTSGEGIPFTIKAGATSNLDSVCGTDPTPTGGAGYVNVSGFSCGALAGAVVANANLNIQALFDTSHVWSVTGTTASTTANKVVWVHGICCGTKVEMVNGEGLGIAGAIPCTIGKTGEQISSATIGPLSCVHQGSGQNGLAIVQGATGGFGNHFGPIYLEAAATSDLITAAVGITGGSGRPFVLSGIALGLDIASSTRYLVDVASGVSVVLRDMWLYIISPNAINDHNPGRGTLSPGTSTYIEKYFTSNSNLFNPTISSGFGSSPSIPTIGSLGDPVIGFTINVGGGGVASSGVIGLPGKVNGYNCQVFNQTAHSANRADDTVQTATSSSTVTVQNQTKSTGAAVAWGANDIVPMSCTPR